MKFNKNDWTYYLARSFTLLGASVWNTWYSSEKTAEVLGITIPNAIFVETHPGFVRHYRNPKQLKEFGAAIKSVASDGDHIYTLLKKGLKLNEAAKGLLAGEPLKELTDEVAFLQELAIHATILPYWAYDYLDGETAVMCTELRALSYYPDIMQQRVLPAAQKMLNHSVDANDFLYSAIVNGEVEAHPKKDNQFFVYTVEGDNETVEYVVDPKNVVHELEDFSKEKSLKGMTAYGGLRMGKVKIVRDLNDEFNEGDILVATSTAPALMPFIRKAAAIVTDEGGMMCHAAIIARELQKPCVVGTKNATTVLQDGDTVEVDADAGTVVPLQ